MIIFERNSDADRTATSIDVLDRPAGRTAQSLADVTGRLA